MAKTLADMTALEAAGLLMPDLPSYTEEES